MAPFPSLPLGPWIPWGPSVVITIVCLSRGVPEVVPAAYNSTVKDLLVTAEVKLEEVIV